MMASVDVYIPCYNYGRFLRDAVSSVLTQEGVDVRVLILDDCSTDESEKIGRELAAEDSRVEFRRHAVNHGHIATYNEGIDWLAGDYCLMLSADDVLTPGALARAASVMDAHPKVALTHGSAISTPHPEPLAHSIIVTPGLTIQTGVGFIHSRCEGGHNYVDNPTAIGRTCLQKLIGYYRPELPHSGDMEMWLRYAAHGSVAYLHAHQAFYRIHGGNMSLKYRGVRDLIEVNAAFEMFFDHYGQKLPNPDVLRRTAYHGISELAFEGAYHALVAGNDRLASDFTRLAHQLDPQSRFDRKWLGLRCKGLLGSKLWSGLRKCRQWFRRRPPSTLGVIGFQAEQWNLRAC
jgi:glycosyltransferase involved in cell wall biosynthesis